MVDFVLLPLFFWIKDRLKTTFFLMIKLLKGDAEDKRVFEFFIFSIVIASFLSFGEAINQEVRGEIANTMSTNKYFSPLTGSLKNIFLDNYVAYYQTLGVLIYLLIISFFLLVGIYLSSLSWKDKRTSQKEQYIYKMILRYFYVWLVTFFCANIFHVNGIQLIHLNETITYFILWIVISLIYLWRDWKNILRALVISLFIVAGIFSYNYARSLPCLKARAMYLSLYDIGFKEADDFTQMYYMHLTQKELFEKVEILKTSLLEIADKLGMMETDWQKAQKKIINYCNSLKNKSFLYRKEECSQFEKLAWNSLNAFSEFQVKSKKKIGPFLIPFPIERILKALIL